MIIAKNISKSFGETIALDKISFNVEDNELFGFIGPDGAGKTTLFRMVTTLLIPDKGNINVMGHDTVKGYKDLRRHIGYMPGRFSLYHDLTVEENLEFYATVFGAKVKENYHLIKDIYSHIEPFSKRQAGKLSGGMKQKLALCCALIHAPRLIVLDEPTTGVDAVSRTEFWEMLKILQTRGLTILISTPYMDEAIQCDRVALIQDSRLLKVDKPEVIINGFDRDLYAISGQRKFELIQELRQILSVDTVNPFGDSIHITFREDRFDKSLIAYLQDKGFEDVQINKIKPGIEDTFLHLMDNKL